MKIGTIIAGLVILCLLTGCTKKPASKNSKSTGPHKLVLEAPMKVIAGGGHSATASWQGGTPPYEIRWCFPGTLGFLTKREAMSPDTIQFEIPSGMGDIGQRYSISVTVTDSERAVSVAYQNFIFANDPMKSRSGGLRCSTPYSGDI